jgi:hypothetical protein
MEVILFEIRNLANILINIRCLDEMIKSGLFSLILVEDKN